MSESMCKPALLALLFAGTFLCTTRASSEDSQVPTSAENYVEKSGGQAKLLRPLTFTIDGETQICGKRSVILDPSHDRHIGTYYGDGGFIVINPRLFETLKPSVKKWLFADSCAEQFGFQAPRETVCFATQRGQRQGWLTSATVEEICEFVSRFPDNNKDCQTLRYCFDNQK